MVPVLDFTQEWTDGLEGYQRLFNRSVVYSTLENGKVVPLTTEFEDVGDLALPAQASDSAAVYDTARSVPAQYWARTAFLSGLPTGSERQRLDVVDRLRRLLRTLGVLHQLLQLAGQRVGGS